jgi:DNA-binding XRE family transcriptional regulator
MRKKRTGKRTVLRLRQLRRAREMSQAALGARVGLDKAMICQIENGEREPSLKKARALAAEFGVSVEDAFSQVEIPT